MTATTQSLTVRRIAAARMPTKWGMFQTMAFERVIVNGTRHTDTALALVLGDLTGGTPLVRIHSQCFTGEVLGSLRCDCNDQLEIAMRAIAGAGGRMVLATADGKATLCLVTVRPESLIRFRQEMVRLVTLGAVERVEAEPSL